jgi:hypothetical protein
LFSIAGMGGLVLGVLAWQEGAESVAALLALGLAGIGALVYWLVRRKREGKPTLLDPSLFSSKLFSFGIAQGILQQIALGAILIALPIYLQLVLGYNALEAGLSLAPVSLTMFGVALLAGKRAGRRRPAGLIRTGFFLVAVATLILIPIVGLSFGLAFAGAVMLAALSIAFTDKSDSSTVLPPADKQHVADVLEDDAQVMSDAQLEELLAEQPEAIQDEIISINTDARHLALQVALLVTLVSALIGLVNAFRMVRLPDPQPASASVA